MLGVRRCGTSAMERVLACLAPGYPRACQTLDLFYSYPRQKGEESKPIKNEGKESNLSKGARRWRTNRICIELLDFDELNNNGRLRGLLCHLLFILISHYRKQLSRF
jgi:hypothetical protein